MIALAGRVLLSAVILSSASAIRAQSPETILIPTVAQTPLPGAHGSQWITEVIGRNLGPATVGLLYPVCPSFECGFKDLAADETFTGTSGIFASSAHGIVIRASYPASDQLILAVRARDLSRALDTWGTEIPIVRRSQVESTPITLFNVPNSERFRTTLRMYDFTPNFEDTTQTFIIRAYALDGSVPLSERVVPTSELLDDEGFNQGIRFAVVTDLALPPGAPDRLRVTVETSRPERFWAFASVTNNETQHVTIVSPQRPKSSGNESPHGAD